MSDYFQDHMPDNVCYGCGTENPHGLQIKSYWEGDEGVCIWHSQEKYQGWPKVLNGGILATLIDCHSMGTALAHAYRLERRSMGSTPIYRYATGTITVRYLKPTRNDRPIELRARVTAVKGRKTTLTCDVFIDGDKTAEASIIAIRVLEGNTAKNQLFAEQ